MEKDISILVVDDHQVVREGLRRMLGQEEGMELVGQGANGEEALFQVEVLSPDIVLMDIKMPGVDGIELTRQLKEKHPSCNVIMLTFYDEYLAHAMEAGAKGYLLKDTKREELVQAIRQVSRGEVVISESITAKPRNEYQERRNNDPEEILRQEQVGPDTSLAEVQLVLPPPVEANQLMRFASQVEEVLHSRVLRVVGSWQEGTALTIILDVAAPLADILAKLEALSEVDTIGDDLRASGIDSRLLKKANSIPRLQNRPRKTIFVTLEKGAVMAN